MCANIGVNFVFRLQKTDIPSIHPSIDVWKKTLIELKTTCLSLSGHIVLHFFVICSKKWTEDLPKQALTSTNLTTKINTGNYRLRFTHNKFRNNFRYFKQKQIHRSISCRFTWSFFYLIPSQK